MEKKKGIFKNHGKITKGHIYNAYNRRRENEEEKITYFSYIT